MAADCDVVSATVADLSAASCAESDLNSTFWHVPVSCLSVLSCSLFLLAAMSLPVCLSFKSRWVR